MRLTTRWRRVAVDAALGMIHFYVQFVLFLLVGAVFVCIGAACMGLLMVFEMALKWAFGVTL